MSEADPAALRVSVIIPHRAGSEVLIDCLDSLYADRSAPPFEVLIVDNGSCDGSVAAAQRRHPQLKSLRLAENQGFAGGCNRGLEATRAEYALLLNDDATLRPGALAALVAAADADPRLAACQPKILSAANPALFEYSGAAGGLMDLWGFPFSRGRLMDDVELDQGQYDDPIEIFWASGVCLLLRRSALAESGSFDEFFFAYMEEIDLCWRLQLADYRIGYVPAARVLHIGGYSLDRREVQRMFLNHRNSLVMLIKNYSLGWLAFVLPIRLALELAIFAAAPIRNPLRSLAVLRALAAVARSLPVILRARREVQRRRRVRDAAIAKRLYLGVAPIAYFVFGVRRASDLPGIGRLLRLPLESNSARSGSRR
jgi:GT2 family glycosyltransferase